MEREKSYWPLYLIIKAVLPRVLPSRGVDGVHVDHRHLLEQDFSLALDQLPRLPVQAGSLQEEPVNVDTLRWGVVDVLPGESCDEILR